MEFERWGSPLVDADWYVFSTKELKGKNGKSCITMGSKMIANKIPGE